MTPRRAYRLASPPELVAQLSAVVGATITAGGPLEVRCLTVRFAVAGTIELPALDFHAVLTAATDRGNLALPGRSRLLEVAACKAVMIQPGHDARYTWRAPHRLAIVCLSRDLVRKMASASGVAHGGGVALPPAFEVYDPICEHLVRGVEAELASRDHPAQGLILQALASALACRVLQAPHVTEHARVRGGLGAGVLRRIAEHVDRHLARRITLDELATLSGVTRFHFARQFRVSTGQSPMRYLLERRIARAKQLVREAELSGAAIARCVGFSSHSHFTRAFRRIVGVSPRQFRRFEHLAPRS